MEYHIEFNINYLTNPGDSLAIEIFDCDNNQYQLIEMQNQGYDKWHTCFIANLDSKKKYTYNYTLFQKGKITIREKAFPKHKLELSNKINEYHLYDTWRWDINQLNLNSSAFTKCIFKFNQTKDFNIDDKRKSIKIQTNALLPKSHSIILVGNTQSLGNWNVEKGLLLKKIDTYTYSTSIDTDNHTDIQYKFVVANNISKKYFWEDNVNRSFSFKQNNSVIRIDDGWIRIPQFADWHGAGIVVPLFSIHTSKSAGIGDFNDLKKLISWASKVCFSAIQLLPINDTTTFGKWEDSYPYNIISAYAINPIYIDLNTLIDKFCSEIQSSYSKRAKQLNTKEFVDFENVFKFKNEILKKIYKTAGRKILNSKECKTFINKNKTWLLPYAAYCCIRDKFKTLDFSKWKGFETFNEKAINRDNSLLKKMQYYYFAQYIAFSQMKEVHELAILHNIILKGDIPIGVNLRSADAWNNPSFFNRNMSTGAPPDYFSEDGQNWGFPTYNWNAMSKDNYSWWKNRFKVMSQYFDAYRIDHVLGFFRIWEIPRYERTAKRGHFSPALPYSQKEICNRGFKFQTTQIDTLFLKDKDNENLLHVKIDAHDNFEYKKLESSQKAIFNALYNDFFFKRHDKFWAKGAIEKLNVVTKATDMLPCAEDLGMLPGNVGKVLDQLNILSLEIQNMPKLPGIEFADTYLNPYRSIATIATHDMPSFRLWWKRFPDKAQRFAHNILNIQNAPTNADTDICEKVVKIHLDSPSILSLLSFQDWTSICESTRSKNVDDEQINNPANPNQHWCYKTHLSIEDLEKDEKFNHKIRTLLCDSKRNLL